MTATAFDRNRMGDASSPYLRQHAGNPVHWQLWDEAVLAHARETATPILLSIGYSACHWCHVMAHECFENPEIAALMNASFVNIKLDREERPDVDRVYQLAHQALSQRGGGWPLTAFLDPQNLSPFYIGTYFPPSPRHGLPGFSEVLQRPGQPAADLAWAIREASQILVQLFSPMMPHLAEECWQVLGRPGLVSEANWPQIERDLLVEDSVTLVVQVNGKKRGEVTVATAAQNPEIEAAVLALDAVKLALDGKPVRKVIIVPKRIVNVVG